MEPAGLTERAAKTLSFIQGFIDTKGWSPSFQEIMDGVGWKSKGTVAKTISLLMDRGYLSKRRNRNRSLVVLRGVPGSAAASNAVLPSLNMDRYQQIEEAILRNCVVVLGEDPTPHEEGALRRLAMAMVPLVDDRALADRLMRISGALANTASEIEKRAR
jgi:hypothetical protein